MPLAPGTLLRSYRIDAAIGKGGMGEVYRAWDLRHDRVVAIKLLDGHSDADRQALRREAQAAAALNHPGICALYEIVDDHEAPFLVMEYLDGTPLTHAFGAGVRTAIGYARQIADALWHAHAHGVVHRDLKGSNVMVTAGHRIKLFDFGIALRVRAHPAGDAAVAAAGATIMGTPSYLSPEVLRGGPAGTRSDVWALGILIVQLITGQHPFAGVNDQDRVASILRDAPAPLPASVPPAVAAIVARCLEKDPARRYRDAGELLMAIEACE